MNGPDHYRAAEQLLSAAIERGTSGSIDAVNAYIAAAQVHATSALTAAIAAGEARRMGGLSDAWREVTR